MCGRYARKSAQELLAEWFEMDLEQMRWAPTWNAAPQSFQPVVRIHPQTGLREASLLRWGLVPSWAKDARIGLNTINARAEEAAAKPAFRAALKKRRCLVPADAFYEWQHTGRKTKRPYAIALQSGEPYAFAGLWESWQPPVGAPLETYTILTTTPNALMEPIHDRMPVTLAQIWSAGCTRAITKASRESGAGWRLVQCDSPQKYKYFSEQPSKQPFA
jgi:putative SOS response-associated peptidase YedK